MHNGGAIAGVCKFLSPLTNTQHDDFKATSSFTYLYFGVDLLYDLNTNYVDFVDQSVSFNIYTFRFAVLDNIFEENFSGMRGSAVYIKYMSRPRIVNCTFTNNGPIMVNIEVNLSPFMALLSPRPVTYYDESETCFDEYEYLEKCQTNITTIDFPHMQGALYIAHC